ncbi:hypothetical protein K7X08_007304 [Anisodus acutangulus]|uniref:Uncharacterized protein n=1 Tax=Anisodus acutangulus TaxID=402998 RepID=A0A9Q1LFY1_9SOLA|nr:hypothetical protein K7X08_007304 [Anisodus acutangulus]
MAEKYSIGLLGVMDRLWFHQIILFSETPSVSFPKNLEKPLPIQDSLTCSLKYQCQELSSVESQSTLLQDVCEKEAANVKGNSTPPNERPTRLNLVTPRNRSHSSSPATDKRYSRTDRYLKDSGSRVLEKTMRLGELELEEVKGFMDLGFIFRKEHLSKRMISVVPGLQRLEVVLSEGKEKICEDSEAISINGIVAEEKDEQRDIARPYLSEAWLIKRPDSPLLNLKIPRISAASDMKKHLRYWAKTVATVVLQES